MASTPRGIRRRVARDGSVRWQVRFLVRDSLKPSGWVETSETFPTLAAAKAFKAKRDGEIASGLRRFDPRAGRVPLAMMWCHFVAAKQPAVAPKTWSGYRQSWDLRIGPSFATTPLEEFTRESIAAWVAGLEAGPWAKVSTLRLLRSILELAVADGRIPVNPAALLSAPPIPPRERNRYLTAAQVSSLATALGDQGDVVLILAYTGLRWSELVGLRVLDVDLANRRLYVRRSAPEVEGKIIVGPPKTKAGTRTVPLPQIVVDALAARIEGRALDAPAVASPNGTMLRSNNWRRHTHWKKTLERLKLEGLTIHGLRHTYASLACSSGADLHYVQKTMGHSSPTVTANIYADLYDHHLDAVADRLDRLIDKTGHKPEKNKKKRSAARKKKQVKRGGPGWDRTSDLPRVKLRGSQ